MIVMKVREVQEKSLKILAITKFRRKQNMEVPQRTTKTRHHTNSSSNSTHRCHIHNNSICSSLNLNPSHNIILNTTLLKTIRPSTTSSIHLSFKIPDILSMLSNIILLNRSSKSHTSKRSNHSTNKTSNTIGNLPNEYLFEVTRTIVVYKTSTYFTISFIFSVFYLKEFKSTLSLSL